MADRCFGSMAALAAGLALAAVGSVPGGVRAETPVSIELVLAVDISRSVDAREFDLQMTGIAEAFRDPEVIDLIGQQDGVAVTLFQWSGEASVATMIPWHLLRDAASSRAFAALAERSTRDPELGFTGIGEAIAFGLRLIAGNGYRGRQLKIDISGDGRDNIGSLTPARRALAQGLGITINGLPILVDTYNLDVYFRDKVIGGPGAFLEIADDYDDFGRAFLRKLRRELAPVIGLGGAPQRVLAAR